MHLLTNNRNNTNNCNTHKHLCWHCGPVAVILATKGSLKINQGPPGGKEKLGLKVTGSRLNENE